MLLSAKVKGLLYALYATILADLFVCACMGYESAAIAFMVMLGAPIAISYAGDESAAIYSVAKEAE